MSVFPQCPWSSEEGFRSSVARVAEFWGQPCGYMELSLHLLPCELSSTFSMSCEARVQHHLVTGSIFHYGLAWVPLLKISWLRPLVVLLASSLWHSTRKEEAGLIFIATGLSESSEVLPNVLKFVCGRNNLLACCQAKLQNFAVPLKFFTHTRS